MQTHNELVSSFSRINNEEEMFSFLEAILTPAEMRDLNLRWELLKMLKQKIPQRQIASELGVSLCKITRGAKILKDQDSVIHRYLEAEK